MSKKTQNPDVSFIESVCDLVVSKELAEINIKRKYDDNSSLNVRVTRIRATTVAHPSAAPAVLAPALQVPGPSSEAPGPENGISTDSADDPGTVKSPMVGTAYLHPEPGAKAFITTGMSVSEGQTLMIIEAMKTMNLIPSPRAGTVKRILVEDGTAVEFGSPLVILE